jgi:hypothetical protein
MTRLLILFLLPLCLRLIEKSMVRWHLPAAHMAGTLIKGPTNSLRVFARYGIGLCSVEECS